jgi:hypothetical protein
VNGHGGDGSMVEDEGDRGKDRWGILPISTCDGMTCDTRESRLC